MMRRSLLAALLPLCALIGFAFTPYGEPFLEELQAKMTRYFTAVAPEKIYLQLDRPLFAPGEDIWLRAYVRDAATLKPSTKSDIVYVELLTPKGTTAEKLTFIASEGAANAHFHIPEDAAGGIWRIKAYTQWGMNESNVFERTITVQKVVLPHLNMKLDFQRKAYGAGDEVEARLVLASLDNKPLANHAYSFDVNLDGTTMQHGQATTDADGTATVRFSLPQNLKTNDGLLNVTIPFEGSVESIARAVPIVLNRIDIQFLPEGGAALAGFTSRVGFKALNEFGKAADVVGYVTDSHGKRVTEFKSYHFGMGALDYTPVVGETYTAHITKPEGIAEEYKLPAAAERGYALRVTPPSDDADAVKLDVQTTEGEQLYVVMHERGKVVYAQPIAAHRGSNAVSIPTAALPIGVGQITIFDSKQLPRAERLVFLNRTRTLKVKLTTNKEKYLPREKVKLSIDVRDERGIAMPGNFSLAVADDKLLTFADDKQGHILSAILLESELKGSIEEPNFYFDATNDYPDHNQALALDYLMLTQGWRRFSWDAVLERPLPMAANKPERALFEGIVHNVTNEVVANAVVKITDVKGQTAQVRTNEQGAFSLAGFRLAQPATMTVEHPKFGSIEQPIAEYKQDFNITIKPVVRGVVTNERGIVIPYAYVYTSASALGTALTATQTDGEGRYAIDVPNGQNTFFINTSYVGYERHSVEVKTVGNAPLKIKLKQSAQQLNEVVVKDGRNRRREVMPAPRPAMAPRGNAGGMPQNMNAQAGFNNAPGLPMPAPAMQGDATVALEKDEVKEGMKVASVSKRADVKPVATAAAVAVAEEVNNPIMDNKKEDRDKNDDRDEEAAQPNRADKAKAKMANRQAGGKASAKPAMLHSGKSRSSGSLASSVRYAIAPEFYAPAYTVKEKVKARTDFRKTVYWNPEIKVGNNGHAEVEFYNNDDISAFRITLEGFGSDGSLAHSTAKLFTQNEFDITTKMPPFVLTADRLTIPVTLSNHSDEAVNGRLVATVPNAFIPLASSGSGVLPANWGSSKGIAVLLLPNETRTYFLPYAIADTTAKGVVDVYFDSDKTPDDHLRQSVEIIPRGFPVQAVFGGDVLTKTFSVKVSDPLKGSAHLILKAHPNTLNEVLSGLEGMIRQPNGCFEQTSSSNYPNIMALNYLRETNTAKPDVEARAKEYLAAGYSRLTSFECKGGGFEWFGHDPAHEALTAYGLLQFTDMKSVYPVSQSLIDRTARWLLSRREKGGKWMFSGTGLHTWVPQSEIRDVYITWALAESGMASRIDEEMKGIEAYANKSDDGYLLALAANAFFAAGGKANEAKADAILKKIVGKQLPDGAFTGTTTSIVASRGEELKIETSALVALAMMRSPNASIYGSSLRNTMKFIAGSKSYNGYGNTQSTVLALKALVKFAQASKRTPENGTVAVYINGTKAGSASYKADEKGDIVIDGLERALGTGAQTIEVRFEDTKTALPYEVTLTYASRTPSTFDACPVKLTTALNDTLTSVGKTVRMTATVRNATDATIPTPIAIIGIPAGLSAQAWQLKELQERKVFDYYELRDNFLVCYYTALSPRETSTIALDLKADLGGTYESPASSAYLYYTPSEKTWVAPMRVVVR